MRGSWMASSRRNKSRHTSIFKGKLLIDRSRLHYRTTLITNLFDFSQLELQEDFHDHLIRICDAYNWLFDFESDFVHDLSIRFLYLIFFFILSLFLVITAQFYSIRHDNLCRLKWKKTDFNLSTKIMPTFLLWQRIIQLISCKFVNRQAEDVNN